MRPTGPRKMRPGELCRLLNSSPLGEVTSERQIDRHRQRAGNRIGQGSNVDFLRYCTWLHETRHSAKAVSEGDPYERMAEKPEKLLNPEKMLFFESNVGRESTHFRIFDPGSFQDLCVVRNFCDWVGLNLGSSKVARVNESLNANAVKLLNVASVYFGEHLNARGWIPRKLGSIKWELLVRLVQEILGSPLRLHEILLAEYTVVSTFIAAIRR